MAGYQTTPGNKRRAGHADPTIRAHAKRVGLTKADGYETWMVDTLTDLMHWAVQHGVDFEKTLRISGGHFFTEAKGHGDPR
jgi:hypothetical protein